MINTRKRIIAIDYIKAFSIIFVIITHLNFTDDTRQSPIFSLLIDMAVPLFIITTSYLCRNAKRSLNEKVQYVVSRIIVPFVVIVIIELIYIVIKDGGYNWKGIIVGILTGGFGPGAYYVPIIIQLTLLLPLYKKLVDKTWLWGGY